MLTSRLIFWISLIASLALAATLGTIDWFMSGPQHQGIFAYQFAFTKARTLQVLSQWGPQGVALYQKTVWLDFIFPIAIAVLTRNVLLRRIEKGGQRRSDTFLLILPAMAVVLDYLENAIQIVLSHDTVNQPDILFLSMSLSSTLKYAAFLLPLLGILRRRA